MKIDRNALFIRAMASAIAALTLLLFAPELSAVCAGETSKVATNAGVEPHPESLVSNKTAKAAASGETEPGNVSLLSKAMTRGAITGGTDPHGD